MINDGLITEQNSFNNENRDQNAQLLSEESEFIRGLAKAKRIAYLNYIILISLTTIKLINTIICLNYCQINGSTLNIYIYLMIVYDSLYLVHIVLGIIGLSRCSNEILLFGVQQRYDTIDTNYQSWVFQIWGQQCCSINAFTVQQNAERYIFIAHIFGEICRFYYILLFIYGNIVFFFYTISNETNQTLYVLAYVFIIFGYTYLILHIMTCICLPCILIIGYFLQRQQRIHGRFVSQIPSSDNMKKLSIKQFKYITQSIENDCIICFVPYLPDDYLVVMPCNPLHCFHERCIKYWLLQHSSCPLCRVNVDHAFEMQQLH